MKILTINFLTCAVKTCKSSPLAYPLHFRDAELEAVEMEFNPAFIRNILPRIEWEALRCSAAELGFTNLPIAKPEPRSVPASSSTESGPTDTSDMTPTSTTTNTAVIPHRDEEEEEEATLRDLHKLLLETQVVEGKMVCGNCGHEYRIKEGIANFLLPNHLV